MYFRSNMEMKECLASTNTDTSTPNLMALSYYCVARTWPRLRLSMIRVGTVSADGAGW